MVLDTNAVLDWLLFRDAGMAVLGAAIAAGQLRWVACQRMRDELAHTLGDPGLARWAPDAAAILAAFDAHAQVVATPPPAPPGLRCTDPDDQVFIDLAICASAAWLVSKDRAVRRLAARARRTGLHILPPAAWAASPGALPQA